MERYRDREKNQRGGREVEIGPPEIEMGGPEVFLFTHQTRKEKKKCIDE